MKYIRYENLNNDESIGILKGNVIYSLKHASIMDSIKNEDEINLNNLDSIELSEVKVLPPTNPSKIVCVGLNYKDHADEFQMELPKEPLLFMKPSTSMIACGEYINYPQDTQVLDFEGELGIVIVDEISKGTPTDEYNLAFTIINDVTARDLQSRDGQWTRSKSFDTFCPCGPVVATGIDPSDLEIKSTVNDEIKQKSNTKNMIFSPLELVKYISNIMTLNSGDLIATGTPPGVGHMNVNDKVVIAIDKIGRLSNIVKKI